MKSLRIITLGLLLGSLPLCAMDQAPVSPTFITKHDVMHGLSGNTVQALAELNGTFNKISQTLDKFSPTNIAVFCSGLIAVKLGADLFYNGYISTPDTGNNNNDKVKKPNWSQMAFGAAIMSVAGLGMYTFLR